MQPDPEPFASEPWRLGRQEFPYLSTLSAAFFHHAVLVPRRELPAPEYVFVPPARTAAGRDALEHTLSMWNVAWEWGHIRPDTFREELPPNLLWIERHPDKVFRLVPLEPRLGNGRLHAYGPLYSLLPLAVLRRFGLPPRGHSWPPMIAFRDHAPKDAVDRLSRALAFHIWPLLSSRSRPGDFSPSDPIRVLSHDLDYWLPFADVVVQRRAQARGRVAFESDSQRAEFEAAQARLPPDLEADYQRPTFGGPVWQGEEEAWEATREVVELADKGGQLRAILDAVRCGRVDDDFSARWSFEREDFERRLHRRRLKWRVSFVELHDTAPVHSPRAEADPEHSLLWQDFLGLVNEKDRRIVVCLRDGITSATEIGKALGYANHSPVSKALARIRRLAEEHLR